METRDSNPLRERLFDAAREWWDGRATPRFEPGKTYVPVTGKVLDQSDFLALIEASTDLWLTAGRFATAFEAGLTRWVGCKRTLLTNSGSSANLVAFSSLTSPKLGARQLKRGDEVVTVAAGFPATVTPILQNGCVPVFVDVSTKTLNAELDTIAEAIGPKTRAIMLAHTLGVPFDAERLRALCDEKGLFLVEDACDAMGATIRGRRVGTFGHFATASFYPAHHITTGEGGAVFCNDPALVRIAESFRDWGRDCWCEPGVDNTCGKRFDWKIDGMEDGYDHKYVYTHVGYNLKATDLQAALGLSQLQKIDAFVTSRRRNYDYLRKHFEAVGLSHHFELPEIDASMEPSWFGFPLVIRADSRVKRRELVKRLESRKIGTRPLFAGNMVRQPILRGAEFRQIGDLAASDRLMRDCFWLGVWPGLTEAHLDYVVGTLDAVVKELLR